MTWPKEPPTRPATPAAGIRAVRIGETNVSDDITAILARIDEKLGRNTTDLSELRRQQTEDHTALKTMGGQVMELHQAVISGDSNLKDRVSVVETRLQAQLPSLRPPRAAWKDAVPYVSGLIAALAAGAGIVSILT